MYFYALIFKELCVNLGELKVCFVVGSEGQQLNAKIVNKATLR